MNYERRTTTGEGVEVRELEDGGMTAIGYASIFESTSQNLESFVERVALELLRRLSRKRTFEPYSTTTRIRSWVESPLELFDSRRTLKASATKSTSRTLNSVGTLPSFSVEETSTARASDSELSRTTGEKQETAIHFELFEASSSSTSLP